MRPLGISLIVVGLTLVCGALVLWPRASRTEDTKEEEKTESWKEKSAEPEEKTESRKEEKTESRKKSRRRAG